MPQPDPAPSAEFEFDRATAVRSTEGGGLAATLDAGWSVGPDTLNGGYLMAVVGRAAVQETPHAHPVALSGSFLDRTPPGPARLSVTPGPAGRTLAHAHVQLEAGGAPTLTVQVTTATLDDSPASYSSPMPQVAPPEECLAPTVAALPGGHPMPEVGIRLRVQTRLDPETAGWASGSPGTEPVIRAWMRLADGREPDPLALVLFADGMPPTTWAIGRFGWAPTVQLQVLVRSLPAPGWCLVEARASEIAGGWLDEDCRIWDSTGRLVAQSRQLARVPR